MKRFLFASILALAALVAGRAEAKVKVVTTIQTFRALTQEVGGDKVEVTALVGPNVDPHFVDPKPSYALTLNKADLLIQVGLELEKGWLPPLISQARNAKIQNGATGNLDISNAGIDILDRGASTSRAQGDIHPMGNPHYWLPPENARKIARAIADRLKAIDGGNAQYYEDRYKAFSTKLDEKKKAWAEVVKPMAGVKLITYHKSWSYLLTWLGMIEIGQIEPKPGVPPDPQHLATLVRDAKAQGARMVIVESFYPRNTAQKVADLAGIKMVVLPSDADADKDYFQLVDYLLAQLAGACPR